MFSSLYSHLRKSRNTLRPTVVFGLCLFFFQDEKKHRKRFQAREKKNIKEKLDVFLSYKDVLCVLKENKLKYEREITKENIDKYIIEHINNNKYTTAFDLIKLIKTKFNITVSTIDNKQILKICFCHYDLQN